MPQGHRAIAVDTGRGILRVTVAAGFLGRAGGLLVRPRLAADEALLIAPCASIHTFWMRYPIDVLFIDPMAHVLRVCTAVPPGRMRWCRGAAAALELHAGASLALGLAADARLAALSGHVRPRR